MKKRAIGWLLVISIILTLLPVSALAAATYDTNYELRLVGKTSTRNFGDSSDAKTNGALEFQLMAKAPKLYTNKNLAINLSFDNKKLALVKASTATGGNALNITAGPSIDVDGALTGVALGLVVDGESMTSTNLLAAANGGRTNVLLAVTPTADLEDCNTPDCEFVVATFYMTFINGATEDDLDISTVTLISNGDMIDYSGENYIAKITGEVAENVTGYGTVIKVNEKRTFDMDSDKLAKPEIVYPNSDVMNLNGVKLDAANRYVNVPVSLPAAGADVTVATTPTAYYTSTCEAGTEISSGVTYTYALQIKDGETARDLTDEEKAVVSVDTDGVVTVKAGAPEATLVVSATGTYTNDSKATGTFEIGLRHGDAHTKNEQDPSDPPKPVGGEPADSDVTKTLTGVEIYLTGEGDPIKVIAADATTRNYDYPVAKPAAAGSPVSVMFNAKELDQYSDEMAVPVGAWSMDTVTGISRTDGGLSIDNTVTNGDYVLTYTAGSITSTVTVKVADKAIVWPVLDKDTINYGEAVSTLTFTGGFASDSNGAIPGAAFSWDTPNAVLNAGEKQTVTMSCKDGEEVLGTKDFEITVNKAKQKIVIDPSLKIEGTTLEIPLNEKVDLATMVENTSVQDAAGKNIPSTTVPTFVLTDSNNLVTQTAGNEDEFTGTKMSADGNDVATLTISAAGDANYDAAEDVTIKLFVTKPVLRATISFDKTNPVYGGQITATITENEDQSGSLTGALTYKWGKIVIEDGKEKFEALTGEGTSGNLTNITASTPATATVTYTPVVGDIGQTLALQVVTPTDDASYGWIHSVQAKMAAPVVRASWGTISGSVKSVTTTSVTVKGETDAWFAIAPKNAPVVAAEGDEEAPSDGHNWVESKGADVVFSTDDAGQALTANTEYTVFMKKSADGYEDAATTFDAKTARNSITPQPNPDDPDHPIPPTITGVTVTAAIDETSGLKFDQTLTASVTVSDTTNTPPVTIDADQWEYQWYRVTPAVADNPETETAITGATGSSYKLLAEDIGKVIRVKAVTKGTCEYIAYASDDTSDVIDKADGPAFDATLGADKASNATATDGAITGLEANKEYEYLVKPVKAEGATEEPTPDWTTATKVTTGTDGKITGLGVNTYLVRIPETATQKASNSQEVDVTSKGYNITGVVKSYNAGVGITYYLCPWDEQAGAYVMLPDDLETGVLDTRILTGSLSLEELDDPYYQKEQKFSISNIAEGRYQLRLVKSGHLTFVINNIVVSGADYILADHLNGQEISMISGDVNGNGSIETGDPSAAWDIMGFTDSKGDTDGSGVVDTGDVSMIWDVMGYTVERNCTLTII